VATAVAGAAVALAVQHLLYTLRMLHRQRQQEGNSLTRKLWRTIPMSRHMRLECSHFSHADDEELTLIGPLEANINIHGTAFAGSIYSVAVLTGWAWTEEHVSRGGGNDGTSVVVKLATIRYKAPLREDFVCVAQPPPAADLATFDEELLRSGKATLNIVVLAWPVSAACAGKPACELQAEFVAVDHHRYTRAAK